MTLRARRGAMHALGTLAASVLAAVAAVGASAVLGTGLAPAAAAGLVVVDDFSGTTLGTRTVTETPAPKAAGPDGTGSGSAGSGGTGGTSARSAFAQPAGGATVVTLTGGDSPAGVQLDYVFPATDLTSAGADGRVLVALTGIEQSPAAVAPATVTLSVTDSTGTTGSYATTLPASGAASLAVDLGCAGGASSAVSSDVLGGCLAPAVDPTRATALRLAITDDAADPTTRTTVGLTAIRAEPSVGGASVSASPDRTPSGSAQAPASATPSPPPGSAGPPTAAPTPLRTSAPPRPTTPPSTGPSATATIEPRPLSPTRPARSAAPGFTSAGRAVFALGQPGSFVVTTTGGADTSLSTGGLPPGLRFTDNGDGTATIAGTPAFDGSTTIRVGAAGPGGTSTQDLAIQVRSLPAFTSDTTATFVRGAPGTFDLTTTGVPTPRFSVSAGRLPAGLTLTDNGDGTATIAGTPTARAGSVSVGVTATNAAGSTDTTLSVQILDAPIFTSPADVSFRAGSAGSFTVTTSGLPTPTIVVDQPLPDWLAFDDFGDGTGMLRTVGAVPPGSSAVVVLRALNAVGADATQSISVRVN